MGSRATLPVQCRLLAVHLSELTKWGCGGYDCLVMADQFGLCTVSTFGIKQTPLLRRLAKSIRIL